MGGRSRLRKEMCVSNICVWILFYGSLRERASKDCVHLTVLLHLFTVDTEKLQNVKYNPYEIQILWI